MDLDDGEFNQEKLSLTFCLAVHVPAVGVAIGTGEAVVTTVGALKDDRVISMGLDMLLQVLRTLERLATEVAAVRFQWNVDTDVRSNMIPFDHMDATVAPHALEIQVVGALATDVIFADMILDSITTTVSLALWSGAMLLF